MKNDVLAPAWSMLRDERLDIVALLSGLSEEQWNAQSLCTRWKTRDVVGHLIGSTEVKITPAMILRLARRRFDVNELIAWDGIKRGRAAPESLLAGLTAIVDNRSLPPAVKRPQGMLADNFLHHQDIRRPLGLPRTVPEERLLAIMGELATYQTKAVNVVDRVAGLRLIATDVDWSNGDGPEVRGTAEAIIVAMGGRPAALADLSGDGVTVMSGRTGAAA